MQLKHPLIKYIFIYVLLILVTVPSKINAEAPFLDIIGTRSEQQISYLFNKGIVNGYSEKEFRPGANLERIHIAIMLDNQRKFDKSSLQVGEVADVNSKYQDTVRALLDLNIITPLVKENHFYPHEKMKRDEMAYVIYKAYGLQAPEQQVVNFIDVPVDHWAYDAVQALAANGVTVGKGKNEAGQDVFAPEDSLTRAEFSLFMARVLDVQFRELNTERFYTGSMQDGIFVASGQTYPTIDEAKAVVKQNNSLLVLNNKEVFDYKTLFPAIMAKTIGTNKDTIQVYKEQSLENALTYVPANTELKLIEENQEFVRVIISGVEGYIQKDKIQLLNDEVTRSYYSLDGDYYKHYIPGVGYYTFGSAPTFAKEGERYYSWNGYTYDHGEEHYQYFQYLPLRSKTVYTAEELDAYAAMGSLKSPLIGLGHVFKKAEELYNINAMYLFAHAIHESNWGLSTIATEKKNLFGYGAIDSNPLGGAQSFETYEEGILKVAEAISKKYLTPPETNGYTTSFRYYYGAYLGNKSSGMNVRYASDPYWGQKIAGRMYRMDVKLGFKELNRFQLGVVDQTDILHVRSTPSQDIPRVYSYYRKGIGLLILEQNVNGSEWYKILSDDPMNPELYVHGDYVKLINIPKEKEEVPGEILEASPETTETVSSENNTPSSE